MLYYLGIDVGGTSLKAGLVDGDGRIIGTASVMVDVRRENFDGYLAGEMAGLADRLLESNGLTKADIPYVGAGVPGTVDVKNGIFLFAPNMPILNTPLASLFKEASGLDLFMGNDANCAALGEYYAGAGRQYASLVLITLGTGVGTGIILDGKMWIGCNGAGAEGGHMMIKAGGWKCGCGRRGCFETYASASGLIRMAVNAMLSHKESALWESTEGDLTRVTGRAVFDAAVAGDATACDVVEEYTDYLAAGVLNIVNLLQPECVALGGGISRAPADLLLEPVRRKVAAFDMAKWSEPKCQIVTASLGNDAGIIGAAYINR